MQDFQEYRSAQETFYREMECPMTRPNQPSLAGFAGVLFWLEDWKLEALPDRIESERRYV